MSPVLGGWPLQAVISGGQTGADQAGVCAARFVNYQTGGRAPKGFLTEEGPAPWLAEFGLTASPSASLRSRTYYNVVNSDGTVIFTPEVLTWGSPAHRQRMESRRQTSVAEGGWTPTQIFDSYGLVQGSGSRYTAELCVAHRKDVCINPATEEMFREWVYRSRVRVLNVAGSRESRARGIYNWVYQFLVEGLVPF